jgi:phytoene synthase
MFPELNRKEKLRRTQTAPKWQKRAYEVTEAIASRDHNNLYLTSLFFRDPVKYKAFCAFYAVMRIVDDRVDNLPLPVNPSEEMCGHELSVVDAWEQVVNLCNRGIHPTASQLKNCDFAEAEALCESLINAFRTFPISMKLWTNFFKAMRSDIEANEFESWDDFLAYAEGATVAPTTIYLSLIVARRNDTKNVYVLPKSFGLYNCGRYLGIFAYLGHIVRDLADDIRHVATRLCITHEDMLAHGVSMETLRSDALRRKASLETRSLVLDLLERARKYLYQGRALTMQIQNFIEKDGRFILELIITIYERIIANIESTGCDPMVKRHHLTRKEKAAIVQSVAVQTDFSLPNWIVR